MKVIERERLNPCTIKLTIEVEPAQVQEAIEAVKRRLARQMRVPGFRPGKAPVALVEQFVQKDVLLQQTAEYLIPRAYREALAELALEPFAAPAVELTQLDEENPCIFTAKVPLQPLVELGDFKGLSAQRPDPTPKEDELEQELGEIRRRNARQTQVDRPAQDGDLAVLNIQPDSEEAGKRFMVIVGQTFPQLDQTILGMTPDQSKSETITFPEGFEEAEWAGKPMTCEIKLVSLATVEVPELDDELAKKVGAESAEDLRQRISTHIEAVKSAYAEDTVTEQLFKELLNRSTIEIPDTMWEAVAEERMKEIEAEQAKNKSTIEALAANQGVTVEQLREHIREDAQMQVKRALSIRDIAEAEDLKLSEEEIRDQIQRLADRAEVSFEVASRELVKQGGMDEVRFRALFKKVGDLLREHANIVTVAS